MEGGQSGTYLRLTRASLRHIEMKQNENEYFGQITVHVLGRILLCIIRKTLKGRKQTEMEGAQSGTYLRLTRVSSGPWVSVAMTYRDEMK